MSQWKRICSNTPLNYFWSQKGMSQIICVKPNAEKTKNVYWNLSRMLNMDAICLD